MSARWIWGRTRPGSWSPTSATQTWTRSSACSRSPGSATGSTPRGACPTPRWNGCTQCSRPMPHGRRSWTRSVCVATATSAVRDAANGAEFLAEVRRRHGFEARLLTGPGGGRAHLPRCHVTARRGAGDARLRHRRRIDRTGARRPGRRHRCDEPRHRLRAHVGALAALRPAHGRRGGGAPSAAAGFCPSA